MRIPVVYNRLRLGLSDPGKRHKLCQRRRVEIQTSVFQRQCRPSRSSLTVPDTAVRRSHTSSRRNCAAARRSHTARHPGRFFDVGMAEEHAVTFAAGLASQGLLPVVAIYSTFFQRAYDQIIHDVNLMQLDVLFAVDRAGLVPGDGATHQGIYDVAFFSNVNIPIFAPANYAELRYWLTYLVREAHGPRMIRYARGGENPALAALPCTGARYDVLDPVDGARVALVSYGAETEEIIAAKDLLAQHGVQADCVKLTQLYPLPDGVCDTLKHYNTILFAEDTVRTGGIGEQLGFAMQQCGWQGEFLLHAVDNSHLLHANVPELRKDQQLDAAALCTDILNALKEKQA